MVVLFFISCGKNGTSDNPAALLAVQIDSCISGGRYAEAIQLIDSLNATYHDDVKLRKESMLSRARAMEGLIRDSIPMVEASIAELNIENDSLKQFFTAVAEKNLPGYIVDKSVKNVSLLQGNVVQPRLGDALSPWSLAVSVRGDLRLTGLSLESDGKEVRIEATDPASRRVVGSGIEMFSFTAAEVDALAAILDGDASEPVTLVVEGEKGSSRIKLSPQMQQAIWRTWRLSVIREDLRKLMLKRELLERKLIVAQDQIANFTQPQIWKKPSK